MPHSHHNVYRIFEALAALGLKWTDVDCVDDVFKAHQRRNLLAGGYCRDPENRERVLFALKCAAHLLVSCLEDKPLDQSLVAEEPVRVLWLWKELGKLVDVDDSRLKNLEKDPTLVVEPYSEDRDFKPKIRMSALFDVKMMTEMAEAMKLEHGFHIPKRPTRLFSKRLKRLETPRDPNAKPRGLNFLKMSPKQVLAIRDAIFRRRNLIPPTAKLSKVGKLFAVQTVSTKPMVAIQGDEVEPRSSKLTPQHMQTTGMKWTKFPTAQINAMGKAICARQVARMNKEREVDHSSMDSEKRFHQHVPLKTTSIEVAKDDSDDDITSQKETKWSVDYPDDPEPGTEFMEPIFMVKVDDNYDNVIVYECVKGRDGTRSKGKPILAQASHPDFLKRAEHQLKFVKSWTEFDLQRAVVHRLLNLLETWMSEEEKRMRRAVGYRKEITGKYMTIGPLSSQSKLTEKGEEHVAMKLVNWLATKPRLLRSEEAKIIADHFVVAAVRKIVEVGGTFERSDKEFHLIPYGQFEKQMEDFIKFHEEEYLKKFFRVKDGDYACPMTLKNKCTAIWKNNKKLRPHLERQAVIMFYCTLCKGETPEGQFQRPDNFAVHFTHHHMRERRSNKIWCNEVLKMCREARSEESGYKYDLEKIYEDLSQSRVAILTEELDSKYLAPHSAEESSETEQEQPQRRSNRKRKEILHTDFTVPKLVKQTKRKKIELLTTSGLAPRVEKVSTFN